MNSHFHRLNANFLLSLSARHTYGHLLTRRRRYAIITYKWCVAARVRGMCVRCRCECYALCSGASSCFRTQRVLRCDDLRVHKYTGGIWPNFSRLRIISAACVPSSPAAAASSSSAVNNHSQHSEMSCARSLTLWALVQSLVWRATDAQQTFQYCLRAVPRPGLLECAGRQALTSLSAIQDADNFTIDAGFVMIRDESLTPAARQLPSFLDQDPMDFR